LNSLSARQQTAKSPLFQFDHPSLSLFNHTTIIIQWFLILTSSIAS
jgi:hypothetical protein